MSVVPDAVAREVEAALVGDPSGLADGGLEGGSPELAPEAAAPSEGPSRRPGPACPPERSIRSVQPLGGGCISPCARVDATRGRSFFLKWGDANATPPDFFREESRSLGALEHARALRVPAVQAVGASWLLLEWLEPGRPTVEGWRALGSSLAAQHRDTCGDFGWESSNYIGSLPQVNEPAGSWAAFWRDRRLLPQLRRASAAAALDAGVDERFHRLFERLDRLLREGDDEGASLLHGDLWSGNVHFLASGDAAAIDPSTYRGHREVDLAMAELFGGFPRAFFDAYVEAWPLKPGYDRRRPVYQLYYLLVHVNLFGRSYLHGLLDALAAAESGAA